MWKVLSGSATGTSHQKRHEACQDRCLGQVTQTKASTALIIVCADGAGSAEYATIGSESVCARIMHLVKAALEEGLVVQEIDLERVRGWCDEVRGMLIAEAASRQTSLREFASTFLLGIVGESCAAFSQIGDGAIVIREGEAYRTVFWPQSGEYASTTNFVTDERYADRLEFCSLGVAVDELAVFTDGLQMLALNYADRSVHAPFFVPMFKVLREVAVADELQEPLRAFLTSDAVNERTDDDKTLILATRRLPNGGQ